MDLTFCKPLYLLFIYFYFHIFLIFLFFVRHFVIHSSLLMDTPNLLQCTGGCS